MAEIVNGVGHKAQYSLAKLRSIGTSLTSDAFSSITGGYIMLGEGAPLVRARNVGATEVTDLVAVQDAKNVAKNLMSRPRFLGVNFNSIGGKRTAQRNKQITTQFTGTTTIPSTSTGARFGQRIQVRAPTSAEGNPNGLAAPVYEAVDQETEASGIIKALRGILMDPQSWNRGLSSMHHKERETLYGNQNTAMQWGRKSVLDGCLMVEMLIRGGILQVAAAGPFTADLVGVVNYDPAPFRAFATPAHAHNFAGVIRDLMDPSNGARARINAGPNGQLARVMRMLFFGRTCYDGEDPLFEVGRRDPTTRVGRDNIPNNATPAGRLVSAQIRQPRKTVSATIDAIRGRSVGISLANSGPGQTGAMLMTPGS